jgi:hypothetical protein
MAQRIDATLGAGGRLAALAPLIPAGGQGKFHGQPPAEDVVDVLSRIRRLNRSVEPAIIDHLRDDLRDTIVRYEKLAIPTASPLRMPLRPLKD